jgi:hypothetical protein
MTTTAGPNFAKVWVGDRPVDAETGLCWDCDSTTRVTCPAGCDNGTALDEAGAEAGRCQTCKGKGVVRCRWPHKKEMD